MRLLIKRKGGQGSGNFGHEGRPGKVGGSTSGEGGAQIVDGKGHPATGAGGAGRGEYNEVEEWDYEAIQDADLKLDTEDPDDVSKGYTDYMKRNNFSVKVRPGSEDTDMYAFNIKGPSGRKYGVASDWKDIQGLVDGFNDVLMSEGFDITEFTGSGDYYIFQFTKPKGKK